VWCAALFAGLALAPWLAGQVGQYVKGINFKYPTYYESTLVGRSATNRLQSLTTGATGESLPDGTLRVTQMRLEAYPLEGPGTNLLALAPECLLDRRTRVAFSTGRLEVVAADGLLRIEGNEGFLVQLTNSTLFVSNRVRTVIHGAALKLPTP
jgi:hypothetical protein